MRGIPRLSLPRWFGGTRGRRNAAALRQTAKNQAQGQGWPDNETAMETK